MPRRDESKRFPLAAYEGPEYQILCAIVDNIEASIWAAAGPSADYAIRAWNAGAADLYGYERGEALGRNYLDLFVNEDERDQAIADHDDIVRTQRRFRNLANDRTKSGVRQLLTLGFPLWDHRSGEWLLAELGVDVTGLESEDARVLQRVRESAIQDREMALRRELLEHIQLLVATLALSETEEDEYALLELSADLLSQFLKVPVETAVWLGNVAAGQRPTFSTEGWRKPSQIILDKALKWFGEAERPQPVILDSESRPSRASVAAFVQRGRRATHPVALIPLSTPSGSAALQMISAPAGHVFGGPRREILPVLSTFILASARVVSELRRRREYTNSLQSETTRLRLNGDFAHRIRKSVDPMIRNVKRLRDLLADDGYDVDSEVMRILADMEGGSVELARAPADIQASGSLAVIDVNTTLRALRNRLSLEAPDISFILEPAEGKAQKVRMVRGELDTLIENIVYNSVEALDGDGAIVVSVTRRSAVVVIDVTDSGPGIPAAVAAQIFVSNVSTKGAGHGSGLARVKQICGQAGGDVELIRSERGAHFRVTLPAAKAGT